jgi:hypothetical protein
MQYIIFRMLPSAMASCPSDIPHPFDYQSQAALWPVSTCMGDHPNDKYAGCAVWRCSRILRRVRVRLHVYESVYDSPHDFMNNLPTSQIGIQFFTRHPLQWTVDTFQPKLIGNFIEIGLWQEIVHRIVWRFVREIARLDGPLGAVYTCPNHRPNRRTIPFPAWFLHKQNWDPILFLSTMRGRLHGRFWVRIGARFRVRFAAKGV